MREVDLIEKLSAELKKKQPLESFKQRFLKVSLFALLCVVGSISFTGVREDWLTVIKSPYLLFKNILLLLGFVLSTVAALLLSVPGAERKKTVKIFALAPLFIWVLLVLIEGITAPRFYPGSGMACTSEVIVLGSMQSVFLFVLLKRAATLQRAIAGFFALLSSAALGMWLLQFTCHSDDPAHLLVWHFLPTLVMSMLGIFVAKKILSKI